MVDFALCLVRAGTRFVRKCTGLRSNCPSPEISQSFHRKVCGGGGVGGIDMIMHSPSSLFSKRRGKDNHTRTWNTLSFSFLSYLQLYKGGTFFQGCFFFTRRSFVVGGRVFSVGLKQRSSSDSNAAHINRILQEQDTGGWAQLRSPCQRR